jgi:hypothetical protein
MPSIESLPAKGSIREYPPSDREIPAGDMWVKDFSTRVVGFGGLLYPTYRMNISSGSYDPTNGRRLVRLISYPRLKIPSLVGVTCLLLTM